MTIWMKTPGTICIRFQLYTAHVSHIKQDKADVTKEVELVKHTNCRGNLKFLVIWNCSPCSKNLTFIDITWEKNLFLKMSMLASKKRPFLHISAKKGGNDEEQKRLSQNLILGDQPHGALRQIN